MSTRSSRSRGPPPEQATEAPVVKGRVSTRRTSVKTEKDAEKDELLPVVQLQTESPTPVGRAKRANKRKQTHGEEGSSFTMNFCFY
jgi:hypothetical protein